MPYHLTTARTEPARTILFGVGVLTLLAQVAALVLSWPLGLINFILVAPICLWALWASLRNKTKHMGWSSFWLGLLWTWTGLTRLIIVEGVGELLWVPFLIVGLVMGVCYLYFSFHRRRIGDFG